MRFAPLACLVAALAWAACGRGATSPKKEDAGIARPPTQAIVVEARPLGLPDVASFGWRMRGGHPAFRVAREAEHRDDWPTVITTCRQALTADPGHLEAAWLLAAALGRQGKHEELLIPLQQAVAGDFGKWGHASLELPALQAFLATPTGEAWKTRIELDRGNYVDMLGRAVIVEAEGDLFAFDPELTRWHRLTRTYGAVIGALQTGTKIVYVTRQGPKGKKQYAVGLIDLARGRTARPVDLGTDKPLTIAYQPKTYPGVWIGANKTWQRIDETNKLVALPPKTTRPPGPYLEVRGRKVGLRALPIENVIADFDDQGLASAIRIGKSNRVVAVPSPGLIDGNSARWSVDRTQLAFVAQLADECIPGSISAAAFVADAATGKLHELERAVKGLAVEWISDRKLALAGDTGVSIYDLDAGKPAPIEGATGLVSPRRGPRCTGVEPEVPEPDTDTLEDPETSESAPVEPIDAGVVRSP